MMHMADAINPDRGKFINSKEKLEHTNIHSSKISGISGYALKYIAMVSMIMDHCNSLVIRHGIYVTWMTPNGYYSFENAPEWIGNLQIVYRVFDILGHMAFPIYVFLLCEGFLHTRSKKRYLLTLIAFALISEPIYNQAHYSVFFCYKLQNVLFTLSVCCMQLWILEILEQKNYSGRKLWALRVLTLVVAGALAFAVRSEYVFLGTLSAALFYLLRDTGVWRILGLVPLIVASPWILLDAPLLYFYNGKRGGEPKAGKGKYFFYIFYPAHFLVLMGIAACIRLYVSKI